VDITSKLIRRLCFTSASPHDSIVLEELISEDERSLFGDKAYRRLSLKQIAREHGWYYGILDKGKRDAPLSSSKKKRNKRHQRVRSQMEHPFAAIKERYGMRWTKVKPTCEMKPVLSWRTSAGISNLESHGRKNPVGSPRLGPPDGWSMSASDDFGQKMVEMALLKG
jgi:IS5 family transposase